MPAGPAPIKATRPRRGGLIERSLDFPITVVKTTVSASAGWASSHGYVKRRSLRSRGAAAGWAGDADGSGPGRAGDPAAAAAAQPRGVGPHPRRRRDSARTGWV